MKTLLFVITTVVALNTSPASAIQRDTIERAKDAFTEQLDQNCASSATPEWIAEDAVYEYALSNINVRLRLEGRTAITEHLCAISESAPASSVRNIRYFPTLHDNIVYVQYDLVSDDGIKQSVSPMAIIEMHGDQIVKFTQLSRSAQSLKALQTNSEGKN
jgi:hypothetical protein